MATTSLLSYGSVAGLTDPNKFVTKPTVPSTVAPTAPAPTVAPAIPIGQRDISTLTAADITSLFKKPVAPFALKPGTVPSTALTSGTTKEDVLRTRNYMATSQTASSDFASYLASQGSSQQEADFLSRLIFPQSDLNSASAQAGEQYRGLLSQAGDYVKGMFGRSSVDQFNEMTSDAGLGDAQKQLQESNVRLAQLRGELMRIRPQIETEAGQTRIGAEARLSPVERNLNAEIASEALVQAALQGNVEMIQNNARTLIDMQNADETRNLSLLENRINLEKERVNSLQGEEKALAERQLKVAEIVLQDRQDRITQNSQNREMAVQMAVQAMQNGAPGALAKQAMLSGTPEQAAAILSGYLRDPSAALDLQLKQAQLDEISARKAAIANGSYVLSEEQQSAAFKLIDDYEARISDITDVDSAYTRILASGNNPSPAGDLALIFNYMKMLDPGSVVRESEFATAESARAWLSNAENAGTNIPGIVRTAINRANTGQRLLPEQRQDFIDRSKGLYEGALNDKAKIDSVFSDRAQKFGVPADAILRDFAARPSNTQVVSDDTATQVLRRMITGNPF